MRASLFLGFVVFLAACERYTDRTSPCFTPRGTPAVSRTAWQPLAQTPDEVACDFVPIDG